MSNEIRAFQSGATTLFAVVRNVVGQVWYPTGEVFETWGTAARTAADYDIALTNKSGGMFVGNFDANISAGLYIIVVHQQAGASPADTDPAVYMEYGYWNETTWVNNAMGADIAAILVDTNEIQGKLPDDYIMGSSVTTSMDDEINSTLANSGKIVYGSVTSGQGTPKAIMTGSTTGFVEDDKL